MTDKLAGSPCKLSCTSWRFPNDDGPCSCGARATDKLAAAENQLASQQAECVRVLKEQLDNMTGHFVDQAAEIRRLNSQAEDLKWNRSQITADRDRLLAEVERMRGAMLSFVETVEHADRCMAARGKGGQQVPYMGDFASAVPSVMSRLKWWARYFRTAIDSALATSAEDGGGKGSK